jgi:hypothetical protein
MEWTGIQSSFCLGGWDICCDLDISLLVNIEEFIMSDTAWTQLVNSALVGTDRTAYIPVTSTGKLGEVLAKLDGTTGELALRQAAAILSSYRQAGRGAIVLDRDGLDSTVVEDSQPDLPSCPRAAEPYLRRMLAGEMSDLFADWLGLLANQRQRVPDRLLPSLLDQGRDRPELREAIAPVLGNRGRWLAARRSDWSYAIVAVDLDPEDVVWETGDKAERRQYLDALRSQNPDRARERLATTFSQDSAADRALFVELLGTNLSSADMPFLESLLTDRSKVVQQAAIALLARLPESSICRGAIEWLRPLLQVQRSGENIVAIDVNPVAVDKGFKRVELEVNLAKQYGEFAATLVGAISAIPLGAWQADFGIDPTQLIPWVKSSDWGNAIIDGLTLAVVREEDGPIATAIIRFDIQNRGRSADLFQLLDESEKDNFLRWVCDSNKPLFWHVATQASYRWGMETTEFMLVQIVQELRSRDCDWSMVHWLPTRMVDCIPDGAIDSVLAFESWDMKETFANNGYSRQGVEKLCSALRFRREAMGALRG